MPAKLNLLNQKFGKLTVIEETNKRKNNSVVWKCKCECGNITYFSTKELRNDGLIQCSECGHNRKPQTNIREEYIGKKYGMFTVLEKTNERQGGKILYKCQCECGNIIKCNITDIKNGHKKSCGCLRSKYKIGEIINNRLLLENITIDKTRPKFKAKCLLCRKRV